MAHKLITLDVVVPCYNEADTIGPCLDALLAQSDDIGRIIVIDNNSIDQTVGIVKSYTIKHPSIILVREKQQGVQFARNTGFDRATADVIGRIDADAVVQDGWAHAIRTYYTSHPKVGAGCGSSIYHDLPFRQFSKLVTDFFANTVNKKFADNQWIYGANMSIRRATWQAIKSEVCMINGIMEDQDLDYHVKLSGALTSFIPGANAYVSGRRIRMSPMRYWRYNKQWWMTFENHGESNKAIRVRTMVWLGDVMQFFGWFPLQFHDPVKNRFRLGYLFTRKTERKIP